MAFSDQESPYSGGRIVILGGSYLASRILKANFWLPVLLSLAASYLIGRFRPRAGEFCRYCVGTLLGQTLVFVIAVALVPGALALAGLDIVLGIVLSIWVLVSLKRIPVFILLALEMAGLGINVYSLLQLPEWNEEMTALFVSVGLRGAIVFFAMSALREGLVARGDEAGDVEEVFA